HNHTYLYLPYLICLLRKNGDGGQWCDQAHAYQPYAKKELQSDCRAHHFGQVARRDGNFTKNPEAPDNRSRIMIAASLCEIATRGDAKLDTQMLKQNRHQILNHDDT